MRRFKEADVFPRIGSRPVSAIEAPELVTMFKAIASRGALDLAKRASQTSSQVFRYAIAHGLASRNPAQDIKRRTGPGMDTGRFVLANDALGNSVFWFA